MSTRSTIWLVTDDKGRSAIFTGSLPSVYRVRLPTYSWESKPMEERQRSGYRRTLLRKYATFLILTPVGRFSEVMPVSSKLGSLLKGMDKFRCECVADYRRA